MKISETCACGAGLTIEDADTDTAVGQVEAWRAAHQCRMPGYRDPASTLASQVSFGFVGSAPHPPEVWA